MRIAALREPACEVPPVFICGSRADHTTEVGASRLLGLGCHAAVQKGGVRLTAFLQDVDSSMTCAVTREYEDPDPAPGRPRPSIEHLAQRHAIAQHSLASLGTGQLLVKNGKRTPNATFIAGRGPHASHPQDPRWETLRPPVLAKVFHSCNSNWRCSRPRPCARAASWRTFSFVPSPAPHRCVSTGSSKRSSRHCKMLKADRPCSIIPFFPVRKHRLKQP